MTFPVACAISLCFARSRYTGKERDAETGLDYFGARYYASNMGRWMSPDWSEEPEPVPYGDLSDPQSLNLYGYVRNNPMSRVDPDGNDCPPACDLQSSSPEAGDSEGAEAAEAEGADEAAGTIEASSAGGLVGIALA